MDDMMHQASYMNRTVEEPKRSVRAPTFSSPMMIVGRRPFQVTLATTSPVAFVMAVCLHSALGSHCGSGGGSGCFGEEDTLDTHFDDDATDEGGRVLETTEEGFCSSEISTGGNSIVTMSYARSPVETSMRDVFSMSGVVNLSNIVDGQQMGKPENKGRSSYKPV
jgi:hypothetical protein